MTAIDAAVTDTTASASSSVRRALLLAGGIGSRLRPLTETVPKCLVEIDGRPLMDYWLDPLFEAGIERALVNTHWLADAVRAYVAASPHRERLDLAHEDELLGTGGTVLANRAYFGRDSFLVIHADNLVDFGVLRFLEAHARRPVGCAITMLTFRTDDPRSCGILELDAQNRVLRMHEKVADPPGNLANGAVYIFEPEVIDLIASYGRPFVDVSIDVLPRFFGRILAVETDGYHRDIGNIESLHRARSEYKRHARGNLQR